jgi:hypothetical protein
MPSSTPAVQALAYLVVDSLQELLVISVYRIPRSLCYSLYIYCLDSGLNGQIRLFAQPTTNQAVSDLTYHMAAELAGS